MAEQVTQTERFHFVNAEDVVIIHTVLTAHFQTVKQNVENMIDYSASFFGTEDYPAAMEQVTEGLHALHTLLKLIEDLADYHENKWGEMKRSKRDAKTRHWLQNAAGYSRREREAMEREQYADRFIESLLGADGITVVPFPFNGADIGEDAGGDIDPGAPVHGPMDQDTSDPEQTSWTTDPESTTVDYGNLDNED